MVGCSLDQVDRTPAQWAHEVRRLLSCGAVVGGHGRVAGVDTIEPRLSSSYRRARAASSDQSPCKPQPRGCTVAPAANPPTARAVPRPIR